MGCGHARVVGPIVNCGPCDGVKQDGRLCRRLWKMRTLPGRTSSQREGNPVKKVIATIAIAGSSLALAACGSSPEAKAEKAWDDLTSSAQNDICRGYNLFGYDYLEKLAFDTFDDAETADEFMRIIRAEC